MNDEKNTPESVDYATRAEETPVERAERLGQASDVDASVPTGQTPEDVVRSMPAANSNEELRIAGDKRRASEDAASYGPDARGDERGQVQR